MDELNITWELSHNLILIWSHEFCRKNDWAQVSLFSTYLKFIATAASGSSHSHVLRDNQRLLNELQRVLISTLGCSLVWSKNNSRHQIWLILPRYDLRLSKVRTTGSPWRVDTAVMVDGPRHLRHGSQPRPGGLGGYAADTAIPSKALS
ncbi:uncharacterized protein PADG_11112 [Paracoccidioides brasiliensis Pb18]|uniref:Uncharacterized protein n=1 Tax=Paracoccidioides brasiliensis (strain Pb18) TaxID=502780 RepID=A0A0A0HU01_PARBD|nr:uncharacterized protein PADG_11112 [Paracoccidioides brasiliensis Pb18]KGM92659.1 hypothetical protein PADG_11112 [Paracoccidioides brasiliensis Pb18]